MSTEWCIRLEKGHISGISDDLLDAIARALQVDEAERLHLFNLARAAKRSGCRRAQPQNPPERAASSAVDCSTPAFVRNGRLGARHQSVRPDPLLDGLSGISTQPANLARFAFPDPQALEFYPDWDDLASSTVAVLRSEAGRAPHNVMFDSMELTADPAWRHARRRYYRVILWV